MTSIFGEIRAWRAWRVVFVARNRHGGLQGYYKPTKENMASPILMSLWMPTFWHPKQEMMGDIDARSTNKYGHAGIFAHKTIEQARASDTLAAMSKSSKFFYVIGSVELWGEMVEHRNGYRAPYADIVSIDEIHGTTLGLEFRSFFYREEILRTLRRSYLGE